MSVFYFVLKMTISDLTNDAKIILSHLKIQDFQFKTLSIIV